MNLTDFAPASTNRGINIVVGKKNQIIVFDLTSIPRAIKQNNVFFYCRVCVSERPKKMLLGRHVILTIAIVPHVEDVEFQLIVRHAFQCQKNLPSPDHDPSSFLPQPQDFLVARLILKQGLVKVAEKEGVSLERRGKADAMLR